VTGGGRPAGDYHIRPFETVEEYRECVRLQEETWGEGFSERVAPAILNVSQRLGGVASGAYDQAGRLVGFVFGMTGMDEEGLLHWSDMLAVRPEARDTGLGRRLKVYQRETVLARGVERMVWTFDPLQSRNAYLNLMKLGVVARTYVRDMYGQTDSHLHRGIGTDRLVALWLMSTERVEKRLAGAGDHESPGLEGTPAALGWEPGSAGHPRPGQELLDLEEGVVSVAVPANLDGLMNDSMELALAWRQATRVIFEAYLDRGYEARELVREGPVSHYMMTMRTEDAD